MFKSIHFKILGLVIAVVVVGVVVALYVGNAKQEKELIKEKVRASRLMAQPILDTIYTDMLEERAGSVRRLIDHLQNIEGIERVQIIRSNGIEAAFKDFKTLDAVKEEFGEIKPDWIENHEDKAINKADGVDSQGFKEALRAFSLDWESEEKYYIEEDGRIFTYLHPIEMRPKCNGCHDTEGGRGILMISSSLDEMYATLGATRLFWIISVIIAIAFFGILLSVLIRRVITGPIEKTVGVIKKVADGKSDIADHVDIVSSDEIGDLAIAFNKMLDTLAERDAANKKLFSTIIKSREEWVSTFDAIADFISIHDLEHRVVKVNKSLSNKLNTTPEALIGKRCYELYSGYHSGEEGCPISEALETGATTVEERDDLLPDGKTYGLITYPVFDQYGKANACVHIARDISGERALKEKLLHSEKMSSIGKFIAGIAHELNNPLMGIMGFSQILTETAGDKSINDPYVKDKLKKIYREAVRTAKIVQSLLTFARAKETNKTYNDINKLIHDTVELREDILKKNNIKIVLNLDKDIPSTMVDFYQIQQVFMNLINNAMDAMVAANGDGTLTISTIRKGRYIITSFSDDGPGIPNEFKEKIFDPFFTTKEVGKGTGLGLSITHGIIEEHLGSIDIGNSKDGGAIISVSLPIVAKPTEKPKVHILTHKASAALTGCRVLVADDEESIRETLAQILETEGCLVASTPDGRLAMDLIRKSPPDIVITDLKMPNIGGIELYNILKKEQPTLSKRVIFLTGDILDDKTEGFLKESGLPFILKPFDPKELIKLIRSILTD